MKKVWVTWIMAWTLMGANTASAALEHYQIDTSGSHAFIMFKISHIGFSWMYGRFDRFDGQFSYDAENPAAASLEISVDVASVNSNHAERDKHLRSSDFFDVDEYPKATFTSTGYEADDSGHGRMSGDLTIKGVTHPITLAVEELAARDDPWGGYRRGFGATTTIRLEDYGIKVLGSDSAEVELIISFEGIRR